MKDAKPGVELPAGDDDTSAPALEEVARRSSVKLLILLGAGVAILLLMHYTPLGDRVRDRAAISALVDEGGIEAAAYFVALTAALMAVGTPRLPFYALGGFAFGVVNGLLLSVCGSLLGSFLMFRAARWGGRNWLLARFGTKSAVKRVADTQPSAAAVALVRMLPISNALINIGLSLSRVGNRDFMLGTMLGFLPQGIVATLVGAGIADDAFWEVGVPLGIAAAVLSLILVWASRRMRAGKTSTTVSNGK
ncbi:MAG TPA: VTT domain-containing protein [Rhodocyclaceae bacterium]|nr:VTT domain-containing protein [Rhodocyclaceae bacterium]